MSGPETQILNYEDGVRPLAFYLWTRPDLAHLRTLDPKERIAGLAAAGELTPAETAAFGVTV
jgi:hypothetical protein